MTEAKKELNNLRKDVPIGLSVGIVLFLILMVMILNNRWDIDALKSEPAKEHRAQVVYDGSKIYKLNDISNHDPAELLTADMARDHGVELFRYEFVKSVQRKADNLQFSMDLKLGDFYTQKQLKSFKKTPSLIEQELVKVSLELGYETECVNGFKSDKKMLVERICTVSW